MVSHALRFRCLALMLASAPGLALGAAQSGLTEISQLAGCFEVTFRFVEDGAQDLFSDDYKLTNPIKEWVGLRKTSEDTFILQHMLFAGTGAFPHWYEIWTWHDDKQVWTQEARGGIRSPTSQLRYRCTAPWTGNRWDCHAGRAEKPLRDEKRNYDWLDRRNILLVTPKGWVHNEHNRKMRASGDVISHELGWITYTRIADAQCDAVPRQFPIDALSPAPSMKEGPG